MPSSDSGALVDQIRSQLLGDLGIVVRPRGSLTSSVPSRRSHSTRDACDGLEGGGKAWRKKRDELAEYPAALRQQLRTLDRHIRGSRRTGFEEALDSMPAQQHVTPLRAPVSGRQRPASAMSHAKSYASGCCNTGDCASSKDMDVLLAICRDQGCGTTIDPSSFDSSISAICNLPVGPFVGAAREGWGKYFRNLHGGKRRQRPATAGNIRAQSNATRSGWNSRIAVNRRRADAQHMSGTLRPYVERARAASIPRGSGKRRRQDAKCSVGATVVSAQLDAEAKAISQMKFRLQALWEELKVPAPDCAYITAAYFGAERESGAREDGAEVTGKEVKKELVRQIALLLVYRRATMKVLRCISVRESRLAEVQQALQAYQWYRGHDTDAVSVVDALAGLRDASFEVARAVMAWRSHLWQPRPFCWRGVNYLEKMVQDTLFLRCPVGQNFLASAGLETRDMSSLRHSLPPDADLSVAQTLVLFPVDKEGDPVYATSGTQEAADTTSPDVQPPPVIQRLTPKAELAAEYRRRYFGPPGSQDGGRSLERETRDVVKLLKQEADLQERIHAEQVRLAQKGCFVPLLRWLPLTNGSAASKRDVTCEGPARETSRRRHASSEAEHEGDEMQRRTHDDDPHENVPGAFATKLDTEETPPARSSKLTQPPISQGVHTVAVLSAPGIACSSPAANDSGSAPDRSRIPQHQYDGSTPAQSERQRPGSDNPPRDGIEDAEEKTDLRTLMLDDDRSGSNGSSGEGERDVMEGMATSPEVKCLQLPPPGVARVGRLNTQDTAQTHGVGETEREDFQLAEVRPSHQDTRPAEEYMMVPDGRADQQIHELGVCAINASTPEARGRHGHDNATARTLPVPDHASTDQSAGIGAERSLSASDYSGDVLLTPGDPVVLGGASRAEGSVVSRTKSSEHDGTSCADNCGAVGEPPAFIIPPQHNGDRTDDTDASVSHSFLYDDDFEKEAQDDIFSDSEVTEPSGNRHDSGRGKVTTGSEHMEDAQGDRSRHQNEVRIDSATLIQSTWRRKAASRTAELRRRDCHVDRVWNQAAARIQGAMRAALRERARRDPGEDGRVMYHDRMATRLQSCLVAWRARRQARTRQARTNAAVRVQSAVRRKMALSRVKAMGHNEEMRRMRAAATVQALVRKRAKRRTQPCCYERDIRDKPDCTPDASERHKESFHDPCADIIAHTDKRTQSRAAKELQEAISTEAKALAIRSDEESVLLSPMPTAASSDSQPIQAKERAEAEPDAADDASLDRLALSPAAPALSRTHVQSPDGVLEPSSERSSPQPCLRPASPLSMSSTSQNTNASVTPSIASSPPSSRSTRESRTSSKEHLHERRETADANGFRHGIAVDGGEGQAPRVVAGIASDRKGSRGPSDGCSSEGLHQVGRRASDPGFNGVDGVLADHPLTLEEKPLDLSETTFSVTSGKDGDAHVAQPIPRDRFDLTSRNVRASAVGLSPVPEDRALGGASEYGSDDMDFDALSSSGDSAGLLGVNLGVNGRREPIRRAPEGPEGSGGGSAADGNRSADDLQHLATERSGTGSEGSLLSLSVSSDDQT